MVKHSKELIFELDLHVVNMLVNIETLQAIQQHLADIRQQLDHTSIVSISECAYSRHIHLLDDLLYYTLKDLKSHYQVLANIVEQLAQ